MTATPPSRLRRLLVHAVIGLGALLAVAAVVVGVRTLLFVSGAETADGQIVGVERRFSGGAASEVAFFPVVEFTTADGRRVRFTGAGGGAREYVVGDTAKVLFDADDPADARIGTPAVVWSITAGLAFTAVLAAGLGFLLRRILLDPVPGGDADDEGA